TSLLSGTDRGAWREGGTVKYMILTYASQRDYDGMSGKAAAGETAWSAADFAAMGAFMESFSTELTDSGELVETRGLVDPVHSRRIRLQEGVPVVTDGPYAETQEVLAGYWIVECESFDRATEIAARLTQTPGPRHISDREVIDVRPIADSRAELDG
ncbi:MAG TPA: YciI family protein, partial [Streptosporangiaceae bacterium]